MTYVAGKSEEQLRRELGVERVVKLGSNENPRGPSPAARAALEAGAAQMHRYPGLQAESLREAVAAGAGLATTQVVLGNGSCDVIVAAARQALNGGGRALIVRPHFRMYEIAARWCGAGIEWVESPGYAYDTRAIADAVTPRTRVVFITNPNNPTGLIVGRRELTELLDAIPEQTLVILDEAYGEYAMSAEYPDGLDYVREGRNVLVTRTFSKIYGLAGLRVGYGIGPEALITTLRAGQPPFHIGAQALGAALGAWGDREFVRRSRELNADGREFLRRELADLGLRTLTSEANHCLVVDLDNVAEIDRGLQERGVIVRPTDASFDLPRCIRVTVGLPEENAAFVEALRDVLGGLGRRSR